MFTAYKVFKFRSYTFDFLFCFQQIVFYYIYVIIIPKTITFFSSSTTNKKVAKMHLEEVEVDLPPIEVYIDVRSSKLPMLNHNNVSAGHHLCEYITIFQSNTQT